MDKEILLATGSQEEKRDGRECEETGGKGRGDGRREGEEGILF